MRPVVPHASRIPDDVAGRPLWTPEDVRACAAYLDRAALVHRVVLERTAPGGVCPPLPAAACEGTVTPPPTPFAAAAPRPGDHPNCRCAMIRIPAPRPPPSLLLRLGLFLRDRAVDVLGLLIIAAVVVCVAACLLGGVL